MGRRLEGQPAVGLDIFRERNANLVEVSRSVLAEIEKIRGDSALRDVQVTVIQNLGKDVTSSLLELAEAGAIGQVLSVIVLFFFLRHWQATLMVTLDRKSVVTGKRVSVRVDTSGGRIIKTKKKNR